MKYTLFFIICLLKLTLLFAQTNKKKNINIITEKEVFFDFLNKGNENLLLGIIRPNFKIEIFKSSDDKITGNIITWTEIIDTEIDFPFLKGAFTYRSFNLSNQTCEIVLNNFSDLKSITPKKIPKDVHYFDGPDKITFFSKKSDKTIKAIFYNIKEESNWESLSKKLNETLDSINFKKHWSSFSSEIPIGTTRNGNISAVKIVPSSIKRKKTVRKINKNLNKYYEEN